MGEDGIWQECKNYPNYFSDLQRTTLTIDSVDEALINNTCQIKCEIDFNDTLGSIETDVASISPHRYMIKNGSLGYLFVDGDSQYGWQEYAGNTYYFGNAEDFSMRTGWQKIDNKWFYYGANGKPITGWKQLGGKWYLFDSKGVMVTGWKQSGARWYYFDSKGVMTTGWKQEGTKWYYLKSDGSMAKNESITIKNVTYKFNTSGV